MQLLHRVLRCSEVIPGPRLTVRPVQVRQLVGVATRGRSTRRTRIALAVVRIVLDVQIVAGGVRRRPVGTSVELRVNSLSRRGGADQGLPVERRIAGLGRYARELERCRHQIDVRHDARVRLAGRRDRRVLHEQGHLHRVRVGRALVGEPVFAPEKAVVADEQDKGVLLALAVQLVEQRSDHVVDRTQGPELCDPASGVTSTAEDRGRRGRGFPRTTTVCRWCPRTSPDSRCMARR